MIGFFEGALSSRRKRAATIIENGGKKSRKKFVRQKKKSRLFSKQQKRGKMMSVVNEAFSSRPKKAWSYYSGSAEKRKRRTLIPKIRRMA